MVTASCGSVTVLVLQWQVRSSSYFSNGKLGFSSTELNISRFTAVPKDVFLGAPVVQVASTRKYTAVVTGIAVTTVYSMLPALPFFFLIKFEHCQKCGKNLDRVLCLRRCSLFTKTQQHKKHNKKEHTYGAQLHVGMCSFFSCFLSC